MKVKSSIAISETGFMFDPNSGESYTTNQVAREIIFLMKENRPEAEIRAVLMEKYDVDEVTLEKNLIDFYAMLRHFDLCAEGNP
jgi:hypothetical protein